MIRFAAATEAHEAGFTVKSVAPNDKRWIRVVSPDGDEGVLFRVGRHKWHWFSWAHEWTGSGHHPSVAMRGGLGDVIDTDSQLRTYKRQMIDAPKCYLTDCAGLYAASSQAFNS